MASGGRNTKSAGVLPNGSAAEALFHTHGSWLRGSLRRRYGADVADDLLQETYLRLLKQEAPTEILKPKAFLMQVARNLFLSHYRRDTRRSELDLFSLKARGQTEAAGQVEAVTLQQIILGLPQPLRDVFVLSRFGGLTNAQIADHLGLSEKTVEWRMTKALAWCAAQLRV